MTCFSFLSGNSSGESMEIQWRSYQFNQRFVVKILEHCCIQCLISMAYVSFLSGNSSKENIWTSVAELLV